MAENNKTASGKALGEKRTSNRILVLADMHLKPLDSSNSRAVELAVWDNERLAGLLEKEGENASILVLLGDTFNFWFERRSQVAGDYAAALNLFKLASEKGLEIHHVSGNRDFVIGEGLGFDPTTRYPGFLRLKSGFTVSRLADFGIEPHGPRYRTHQAGKTIAFVHGDALCGNQRLFMLLRWFLQGPLGRTAMRNLPWSFLQFMSRRVQARTKTRAPVKNPAEVFSAADIKREIAMGGDLLLCGHIHALFEKNYEVAGRVGRLIAIPAWLDGYYGIIENGELTIHRQKID